jgi:hypothetical protein
MAKAVFQRNQKVWVESVGAWAVIEKIVPIWARGFEEPVRVTYDVGLGREFLAQELRGEQEVQDLVDEGGARWRLLRARNKWQMQDDCRHHPYPGTYPVVVTNATDWGGWRVPGAEYDRDPQKIEHQARVIASIPRLMAIAKALIDLVGDAPEDAPPEIRAMVEEALAVQRYVQEVPAAVEAPPETSSSAGAAA